jgi:hypothetical protein
MAAYFFVMRGFSMEPEPRRACRCTGERQSHRRDGISRRTAGSRGGGHDRLRRRDADARPHRAARAPVVRRPGHTVRFPAIPIEEHLLLTLKHAKLYLDQGFTSCFSAAATKPRLDIVTRNAIDRGEFPGPRLRAASVQLTVTGGVGDLRQMHLDPGDAMYTLPCDGADAFRRAAREACREGVDVLKIVPSVTRPRQPSLPT